MTAGHAELESEDSDSASMRCSGVGVARPSGLPSPSSADAEGDGVGLGDPCGLGLGEGVADGEGDGGRDGEGDGEVGDGEDCGGDGDADGEKEGEGDGEGDGGDEGVGTGLSDGPGSTVTVRVSRPQTGPDESHATTCSSTGPGLVVAVSQRSENGMLLLGAASIRSTTTPCTISSTWSIPTSDAASPSTDTTPLTRSPGEGLSTSTSARLTPPTVHGCEAIADPPAIMVATAWRASIKTSQRRSRRAKLLGRFHPARRGHYATVRIGRPQARGGRGTAQKY